MKRLFLLIPLLILFLAVSPALAQAPTDNLHYDNSEQWFFQAIDTIGVTVSSDYPSGGFVWDLPSPVLVRYSSTSPYDGAFVDLSGLLLTLNEGYTSAEGFHSELYALVAPVSNPTAYVWRQIGIWDGVHTNIFQPLNSLSIFYGENVYVKAIRLNAALDPLPFLGWPRDEANAGCFLAAGISDPGYCTFSFSDIDIWYTPGPTPTPTLTATPTATFTPTITPTPIDPDCRYRYEFDTDGSDWEFDSYFSTAPDPTYSFSGGSMTLGNTANWTVARITAAEIYSRLGVTGPFPAEDFTVIYPSSGNGRLYRIFTDYPDTFYDLGETPLSGNLDGLDVGVLGGTTTWDWLEILIVGCNAPTPTPTPTSTPDLGSCYDLDFSIDERGFSASTGFYSSASGWVSSGGALSITGPITPTGNLVSARLEFTTSGDASAELTSNAEIIGTSVFTDDDFTIMNFTETITGATTLGVDLTGVQPTEGLTLDLVRLCPFELDVPTPTPTPTPTATGPTSTATATATSTATSETVPFTSTPGPPGGGTSVPWPTSAATPIPGPTIVYTPVITPVVVDYPIVCTSQVQFFNYPVCNASIAPAWPGWTIDLSLYFWWLVGNIWSVITGLGCLIVSLWSYILVILNFLMLVGGSMLYTICLANYLGYLVYLVVSGIWIFITSLYAAMTITTLPDTFMGRSVSGLMDVIRSILSIEAVQAIFTFLFALLSFSVWKKIAGHFSRSGGSSDE